LLRCMSLLMADFVAEGRRCRMLYLEASLGSLVVARKLALR